MTINILFVCMGNICRSPAAAAIMKDLVDKNKLSDQINIDSCGIIDYHVGQPADPRMQASSKEHGYDIEHTARKFYPKEDFSRFDYIIAMDNENFSDLRDLARDQVQRDKIIKMADFANDEKIKEVPDPYHSDQDGFKLVIKLLEETCQKLLDFIKPTLS